MPLDTWLPQGGGAMGELIRRFGWEATPAGSFARWPQSLRTTTGLVLDSGYGMMISWGGDFTQIYNDAFRPILGTKHPGALGQSARECFRELWDTIGPMFQKVMDRGESTTLTDALMPLNRFGFAEDCYFTFSYSAIRDEAGGVGGVLVTCIETTKNVLSERRLRLLRELAAGAGGTTRTETAAERIQEILAHDPYDIPFARLHLSGAAEQTGLVDLPSAGHAGCSRALVLTLGTGAGESCGWLMAGLNPRLPFDDGYESFLHLAAAQIATALDNARAHETERQRAEALAEIDRAKTTFFTNVSHEFRTPLTLVLAPLEQALEKVEVQSGSSLRESLGMAHRNALRLLKLVNTLLEFSRIEAGRVRAAFEPLDLAQYTAEVASAFRATIESAALTFHVDCPALPQPVFVDREMWEKVVLNLVSNAYKHTFEGSISVSMRSADGEAVLEVSDTGIGIPEHELPRILERFYRVEGARGRTFEGTGIGLALVAELVRLHSGRIVAVSTEGEGSVFRVSIPLGVPAGEADAPGARQWPDARRAFVQEASQWNEPERGAIREPQSPAGRVLFADDNADVREYVSRILSEQFTVLTVANGEQALREMESFGPDLVLTDVMVPKTDGYELLAAIRSHSKLSGLPVILLSARAGEEARIDGLRAGADDYVIKPFTARELAARVESQITIGQLRQRAAEAERAVQRRFRELLMQTPAGIALLQGPDHVFELVNSEYVRLVGRSEEELVGRRAIDVFPEAGQQGFIELLDGVYHEGAPLVGTEQPLQLKGFDEPAYVNFVYQPVRNARGESTGVFVYVTNVTDTVRSRTRVEASERELRTLADSIPQLVWACRPDGDCVYLSTQWVTYTGIPEAEQLGLRWLEVMYPDDRTRTYEAWMAAVAGRQAYDIEFRLRRHDGAYRWFKTRGTPVRDASGAIQRWFGTCTDIEDQKLAETHMLQQQKLESVGLLAGGIAHDFNNLLVGVLGNASLIDESLPEKHALRPMVEGIVEAGERAAHLTRQMLAYAGKGRLFIERVDLNALAASTAALVEASFPKSTRMILEPDPLVPAVDADSGQMQQILMNLAINGAEAVGPESSGAVWIRTGHRTVDEEYVSSRQFVTEAPAPGDYVSIEVQDTGSGIAPDTLAKVFDPFFTTKFTGRGLGLAAVMGIVRAARGSIEIRSAAGRGTTFRVLLPAAGIEVREDAREEPRHVARSGDDALVLIVDDEEIVRKTSAAALRKAGYSVLLAGDGAAGLNLFRAQASSISAVVLDMSMPGLSGKEVLVKLREMDERVPVLIFSGFSEEQVHRHFAGMNISGFVQKPFTGHQIASAVHELLRRSPEIND